MRATVTTGAEVSPKTEREVSPTDPIGGMVPVTTTGSGDDASYT